MRYLNLHEHVTWRILAARPHSSSAIAEMCFKVTDDFSNVVEAIEAAINITKEIIQEFGRYNVNSKRHVGCVYHNNKLMNCHACKHSNALNVAVEWRFTGASNVTLEGNYGEPGDIFCWLEFLGNVWSPYWDVRHSPCHLPHSLAQAGHCQPS